MLTATKAIDLTEQAQGADVVFGKLINYIETTAKQGKWELRLSNLEYNTCRARLLELGYDTYHDSIGAAYVTWGNSGQGQRPGRDDYDALREVANAAHDVLMARDDDDNWARLENALECAGYDISEEETEGEDD
jgi:hypothetical protein